VAILGAIAGLIGVFGMVGVGWGLLAPYGWFAGEDVDRRSRARRMASDLVKQVLLTIIVVQVWLSIRG